MVEQPTDIAPEVAATMLEFSRTAVQPAMRAEGDPFGPEQPCPPDRPAAEQLAAFLGRRVSGS